MKFVRVLHFYASHRNQHLDDKCRCLHGHRYEVEYELEVRRDVEKGQHVSVLFSDLDGIDKLVRRMLDHSCMMDRNDPLSPILQEFAKAEVAERKKVQQWKFAFFPFPTSAENLAFAIFDLMFRYLQENYSGVKLTKIALRETDSTVIHYNEEDCVKDKSAFHKAGFFDNWTPRYYVTNIWTPNAQPAKA